MIFKRRKRLHKQPRNYQQRSHAKQPVFSYSSSRSSSKNSNNRDDPNGKIQLKKINIIVKIQYGLAGLLVLVGLGYLSSLSTDAQVRIETTQAFPQAKDAYRQSIHRELEASWLDRSKLALNEQKLADEIKSQFPEILEIEVKTSLLRHRPFVTVQLAQPIAKLVTPSATYVLDGEGRALFEAQNRPTDFDGSSLVAINDNSAHPIQIGKPAVTADQISYVREVIGQFKRKKIKIKDMNLESGGLDLYVRLRDDNHFIKFSFLTSPRLSSGEYFALRDKNITISQYADLRIPERAYVR